MDSSYKNISECLLCESKSLSEVFSADDIALTGFFPAIDQKDRLKTPITLMKCNDCSNIQMKELQNLLILLMNGLQKDQVSKIEILCQIMRPHPIWLFLQPTKQLKMQRF